MGMSHDEFKTAFLKDQAERKKQRDREYSDYVSIAAHRMRKCRSSWKRRETFNTMCSTENF